MSIMPDTLTIGAVAASNGVGDWVSGVVFFALRWLIACVIGALFYSWLVRYVFKQRNAQSAGNRGVLFVAFLLISLGIANLDSEVVAFTALAPFFALVVPILFLLYFYVFADARYTPRWARWLGILYAFTLLAPLSTTSSKQQSNDQYVLFIAHTPGLVGALLLVGNIGALTLAVSGIVPQVYYHYRQFALTGELRALSPQRRRLLWIALWVGSAITLLASAAFAQSAAQISAFWLLLTAQSILYLLVGLLPLALGYALLRRRLYDRAALSNRALTFGGLTLALILIYLAGIAIFALFLPGFTRFTDIAYAPFIMLFALIMVVAFRPLLAWLQTQVNQRFYRRTYDAVQALAPFTATLYENPQLDALSARLVTVVQKALLPDATLLWLRTGAARSLLATQSGRAPLTERSIELRLRQQAGMPPSATTAKTITLAPTDPARVELLRPASVLDVPSLLTGASPAMGTLAGQAMALAFPLISSGELIGLLTLGTEADGRPCTVDERELLTALADQVAPVLRSALLTHEEDVDERERERLDQELQTARRIQEALLPKATPILSGWQLATCYQPAREVGGDFYDFIPLRDGRLGIVLGDVTDKGMPAALVMATTRTMIRAITALHNFSPGEALKQVNDLLHTDIPAGMFVTCFYAILDPASGQVRFANAGQDLPILRHADGALGELHATGMPLGLLPAMRYDEGAVTLMPGDSLLFYSDGLVEAHNPQREMFDLPRLQRQVGGQPGGAVLIASLLAALMAFTGLGWEQEDDVTLVTLQRLDAANAAEGSDEPMKPKTSLTPADEDADPDAATTDTSAWRRLDEWTLPSAPGNERLAIARVAETVSALDLAPERLEALKTAVGEATMNAMEHGNNYSPDLPVTIEVVASQTALAVRITDEGGSDVIPQAETPDLDAKLAGLDTPRGWGLYLIKSFVDEVRVTGDGVHHTVELILALHGEEAGSRS